MDSLQELKEMASPTGVVLYTVDSKGRTRAWACWYAYLDDVPGIFYTDCLLPNGKIKDSTFKASKEKNVGKKNYISAERQAELMLEQEVGKKLRSNYFYTEEEAKENKLWLPMLAHKYEDWTPSFPVLVQPKLDGARCNVMWNDKEGKVIMQTRTGKRYISCPHIVQVLEPFFAEHKNIILDGELYNHDLKDDFEKIMSLIRKTKVTKADLDETREKVQFHIYDCFMRNYPEMVIEDRLNIINNLPVYSGEGQPKLGIEVVDSYKVESQPEMDKKYSDFIEEGYEGMMLRVVDSVYKVDGRSKDLLKRKDFYDEEFTIVDIQEGDGNWKGRAKRIIVEIAPGVVSGCGIRGSYDFCEDLLKNKEDYIGGKATVMYFEKTKEGALRFPVVIDVNRHD